ncbi:MAG: nucleoside phosphorylase [Candidatus Hermodarchaeota archaeon]
MSYPNFPNKYQEKSLSTAKRFWSYKRKIGRTPKIEPPKGVIICYSTRLLNYIIENHSAEKVDFVFGDSFYLLEEEGQQLGVCGGFGIGAPIVGIILEELTEFGVKSFLSIGTAGALQKELKLGSLVICDRAIRDEGTSHHYLEVEKYSYASKKITKKLCEVMKKLHLEYTIGTTWTIDAPYRETFSEIARYKQEHVLTVDMEAAAFFAVAQYLGVDAGVIFTISDYLSEDDWELHFHLTEEFLHKLFLIAKETINSL